MGLPCRGQSTRSVCRRSGSPMSRPCSAIRSAILWIECRSHFSHESVSVAFRQSERMMAPWRGMAVLYISQRLEVCHHVASMSAVTCFFTEAICERSPTYPPKPVLPAVDHLLGARSGRGSGAKSNIVRKSVEKCDFLSDQRDCERLRMIRILTTALLALSLTASGVF